MDLQHKKAMADDATEDRSRDARRAGLQARRAGLQARKDEQPQNTARSYAAKQQEWKVFIPLFSPLLSVSNTRGIALVLYTTGFARRLFPYLA